jgi:cellulose synthase/poly-beta-1,6-N-acetylglucosamine synthase-like glycosyltransferase
MWKSCPIRHDNEETLTKAGLLITIGAVLFVLFDAGLLFADRLAHGAAGGIIEQALFILVVCALTYGNLVYQICRLGSVRRDLGHMPVPLDELERAIEDRAPTLTVLVPAYKEEPEVVFQTLLSAALMRYPAKRVVLLLDDPPAPTDPIDAANLSALRGLPDRLTALLAEPGAMVQAGLRALRARGAIQGFDPAIEAERLARHYDSCAGWYENLADSCQNRSHVDRFFVEEILRQPARRHRQRAQQWRALDGISTAVLSPAAIESEYRRLLGPFTAAFATFERKRYANLSKEANKAMNLNSYLAVMGKRVRETHGPDGLCRLDVCGPGEAGQDIADADYVVTLDADSLLRFDYAVRLVAFLERPENARVAVAQTPYSAYPQAPGALERIAGATTDIQHIVHQGFTRYDGTYWVGANALIRKAALDDIATIADDGMIRVVKYIQDQTVIEDTESTVDLLLKGWSLYNYPDRLAYSATPPDFGSLVIQRRRWSNGGLIILPKLLRLFSAGPLRALQGLVQIHYLLSPAATSVAVLLLILYPFEESMRSPWLPLTVLPFFYFYGRDLTLAGYGWADLLRVYALNLMLLPVQLGGTLSSMRQIVTGQKTAFGRTPKVQHRTASPKLYVGSVVLLAAYCLASTLMDFANARWVHALFTLVTGLFLAYALVRFIGLRTAYEDLTHGWFTRRRRLARYLETEVAAPLGAAPTLPFGTAVGEVSRDEQQATIGAK